MKRRLPKVASLAWAVAGPMLAGCSGPRGALDPAGIQAERVAHFWWFAFTIATAVFVLVVGVMLVAAFRPRPPVADGHAPAADGHAPAADDHALDPTESRVLGRWVMGAVAVTIAILLVFLVDDYFLGRSVASLTRGVGEDRILTIEITGHQWWWEVTYPGDPVSRTVTTANEIHVPVGRPVRLVMTSADVIHSFWVPSLNGKKDLIPGHQTVSTLRADEVGVFRGQCAEFCGHQHANMGLLVVAEPPAEFEAWYERQLEPGQAPDDPVEIAGQRVFLTHSCVLCHTIRGTSAGGNVAPDLTHLAGRRTLAAGTLPNTRGHLGGWIINSQSMKPGNHMPPNQIAPAELQALLAYLESLR